MSHQHDGQPGEPECVNPLLALPAEERLARAVDDFWRAGRMYRILLDRLRVSAVLADDQRLGATTRQFLGIVHQSGAQYLEGAVEAVEAAAQRLTQAAGAVPPVLDPLPSAPAPLAAEPAAAQLAAVARDYETLARALYSLVVRLTDAAEAVGDMALTGDTHPYGDIVYGIVIPYLLQSSDALAADAARLAG